MEDRGEFRMLSSLTVDYQKVEIWSNLKSYPEEGDSRQGLLGDRYL